MTFRGSGVKFQASALGIRSEALGLEGPRPLRWHIVKYTSSFLAVSMNSGVLVVDLRINRALIFGEILGPGS